MKTSLTAGLPEKERTEVVADFKASPALRARLVHVLRKKIESERSASLSKLSYESPSWSMYQADTIGYERGLKEVISLLEDISVDNQSKTR